MRYTEEVQKAVERAAERAAQEGLDDSAEDYEQTANKLVAQATGFAEGCDEFEAARSDFDYLLEQAL